MAAGENSGVIVVVAAHNEAERIGATLSALREAFDGASLWVADDGSSDATAAIAEAAGVAVARVGRRSGKGRAMTLAARAALASRGSADDAVAEDTVVLLCDGDLGRSAVRLSPLVEAVGSGAADLAVAAFARRSGGGFGVAVGFARAAIRRRCGLATSAPLSGQRALRAGSLQGLLPFARGYGMEPAMTIEAVRAGLRVREIELDLAHRATGRTPAGFAHRARQLFDCVRVYVAGR
jgi:glycosyltransferase involved in cell wall biosynthesis